MTSVTCSQCWSASSTTSPALTSAGGGHGSARLSSRCWANTYASGGGGRILRTFPPSEELWTRFYYRTQDFTPEPYVSGEHDLSGNGYPSFSWRTEAHTAVGREMQMRALNPAGDCGYGPYQACKYVPNMAHIPIAVIRSSV